MKLDIDLDFSASQHITPARGTILVAEPFLGDPHFERSVVLLCENHKQHGAFGFILNRQTNLEVGDVIEMSSFNQSLYVGGPVEHNTLHFIHTISAIPHAVPLRNGIYWGGDFDYVKSLAIANRINENNSRFFVGYSGWAYEQLQEEINKKSWIATNPNLNLILNTPTKDLWREVLKHMGGKYKAFSNYPLNPRFN
jgi:putative transcriptional regulator